MGSDTEILIGFICVAMDNRAKEIVAAQEGGGTNGASD